MLWACSEKHLCALARTGKKANVVARLMEKIVVMIDCTSSEVGSLYSAVDDKLQTSVHQV